MLQLFDKLYGGDFLEYYYSREKGQRISENSDPRCHFNYDHESWEANYPSTVEEVNPGSTCKGSGRSRRQLILNGSLHKATANQSRDTTLESVRPVHDATEPLESPAVVDLTDDGPDEPLPASDPDPGLLPMLATSDELTLPVSMSSTASRAQFSKTRIPMVSNVPLSTKSVFGHFRETNPLLLKERPPEGTVVKAEEELRKRNGGGRLLLGC